MASFGESFVDAYLAGKQMKRQREEDARKRKLEEELATVVRPGDIIGARGSAPAYDAEKFSTDAGVSIGDRPLSDFQPPASMANAALPAAGLAAPAAPSAQARAMRPAGLSPMSQLPPALAGEAGIVRPTVLAGGPPVGGMPVGGMPVGGMPVAPLGHSAGAQPMPMPMDRPLPAAAASLPDPEKLVFYRDPTTGKGMAVEKGRERVATDADAAISAAAVYMANGDAQTATKMMRDAYALREASFKDEQITLQRALISAGVQNGGMTPAAITQFAAVYNDKIEDGVKLTPSVGPDGKLALGVGSENADTPMLWVNPVDGSMSRTPVYVTGAQAGSYLQTLITGNYAAYQADIVQAQTAAAATSLAERKLANDTAQVALEGRRVALGERQYEEGAPLRAANVALTRANIGQNEAATESTRAQTAYNYGDSLPVRTNNGGAIKDGAFARGQPGYTGSSGGFATFATPEAGAAAQIKLLRDGYLARGFNTVQAIVGRYAPIGPENSAESVANYTSYVARRAGVDPTQPIPESKLPAVAAAMREFESGNTGPAPGASASRQFRSPADRDKAVSAAWTEINRQLTAQQAAGTSPQDLKALELSLKARYQEQLGVNFGVPPLTALASGGAGGMAPSYVADLRAKGSVPGVIEAAVAKYPQMADDIAKLAGPDAIRAYRQRVASPPPAVSRSQGGPAVRDTTLTGALGRALYGAGRRSGDAQAQADARWARDYGPRWVEMYRRAATPGGKPMSTGEMKELSRLYRSNDAFKRSVPADMRAFMDRQIAAQ